jgi:PhnB protein
MSQPVKAQPEGCQTVIPYLVMPDPERTVEFLVTAFGATVKERMKDKAGAVQHAEVRIGDSVLMLGRARGEWTPMPCSLYVYVPDTDEAYRRALKAGARSVMEPANQFYGDRNAGVKDAAGNTWWLATHVEDVSPEEMQRRNDARG